MKTNCSIVSLLVRNTFRVRDQTRVKSDGASFCLRLTLSCWRSGGGGGGKSGSGGWNASRTLATDAKIL